MSTFPRYPIVEDLERFNEDLCIEYLDHLIKHRGDGDPNFHEKLAFLLLRRVERAHDADTRAQTIATLLEHLQTSTQYRAERILHRIPTITEKNTDFCDVRALLLGHLGQHEAALRIYVDRLHNDAKAEEYCKKIAATQPDAQVFLILLQIYLQPKKGNKQAKKEGESVRLEPALGIISRHGSKLDAESALKLLPSAVPVASLQGFTTKTLRQMYAKHAEALVLSKVSRERALQVEEQQMTLHRRRVKVTEART